MFLLVADRHPICCGESRNLERNDYMDRVFSQTRTIVDCNEKSLELIGFLPIDLKLKSFQVSLPSLSCFKKPNPV